MKVVKRDGRVETYDYKKIKDAVGKAAKEVGVTPPILKIHFDKDEVTVDEIHDAVEKHLMKAAPTVAKAYILYRQKRTDYRTGKSDLVKGIDTLLENASKDNANSENSMASKAHFVAEHVLKEVELAKMPQKYAEEHRKGILYVHDLPYRHMSVNCFFSPLGKMLKQGFDNGTGYVRPPKHITTAGALASIILQSMQSNFFGGEGYVHWDSDLAPYAKGEYERQKRDYIDATGCSDVLDEHAKRKVMDRTRDAVFQAMQAFVYNANTQKARSGGQNVFSSINFGTDTSFWGRMITEMTLKAFMEGMGHGEMPFFPVMCYRVKDGINLREGDPNYDLTMLALECVGKRIMPRFVLADSDMYKDKGNAARMGCRTNVGTNVNGDSSPEARGNLSFDTINLPYIALLAKEKAEKDGKDVLDEFWGIYHEVIDDAIGELWDRYKVMCSFKAKDFPFASKWYMGHENLKGPMDSMEKCWRNGSLSVGYIGLAECLIVLTGKHHGESEEAQQLGLEIVGAIRKATDEASKKYNVTFACFSTPAENACFTLMNKAKKRFGVVKGVTDHEFLTNSCHIPVWAEVDAKKKIDVEGPYHLLANGGSIFYLELGRSPRFNVEGLLKILQYAVSKKEIGYMGFNFETNFCRKCHHRWDGEDNVCPVCGSDDVQSVAIVTGYLADKDRVNDGKLAEIHDRVSHTGGGAL